MQSNSETPQDTSFLKNNSRKSDGIFSNLDEPMIMGILNVTPDSFFDGGKYNNEQVVIEQVEQMINDGAKIIDIGGYSSRPNAENITAEEELKRVLPVVKLIRSHFPDILISIDTFRAMITKECVNAGADIVNDISGGAFDEDLLETVARFNVPYILMHIKGNPQSMQKSPNYTDIVNEVHLYFEEKITLLKNLGIKDVIIDPGFGFGKTVEHNYQLLKHLNSFNNLSFPILAGLSRKSMINKVLDIEPKDALNGTSVLNTIALLNGAKILRVHDVKEAAETIKLVNKLKSI